MPQVIAKGLIERLEKIKTALPVAVSATLSDIGERMKQEINNYAAYSYSPSWQKAVHKDGPHKGEPYFMQQNDSFGIMDAISKNSVSLQFADNIVSMGFGNREQMDTDAPFWRLFEDEDHKVPDGDRAHGNPVERFVPSSNGGKTGEGYSQHASELPKRSANTFYQVYSNPGFYPVRLFGDTNEHYQGIAKREIIKAIKQVLRDAAS